MKLPPYTLQGVFLLAFTASTVVAQETTTQTQSNPTATSQVREASKKVPIIITTIDNLGADPSRKQIGAAIFGLLKIKAECALDIVYYAVKTLPAKYAPEIIAAATSGLPNPWKQIVYPPGPRCPEMAEYYAANQGKNQNAPTNMLLIEALVFEALYARPELSMVELQGAAESSLKGNPDLMLSTTFDSRVTIGVGVVGNANYSNEPLRRKDLEGGSSFSTPNPTPKPPPVSK